MPIKILLADKSITIQKVVEMLFSGKEYAVMAVSDGDAAMNEAVRVLPDVVLADVDLPRLDGYGLSSRFRQTPQLARTPVILMLSRDDVFDEAKGRQAGINDHIAKPFESQELIGKIKKALASAPAPAPAAPQRPATPPSAARAIPAAPSPPPPKPKAVPTDIFDIIQEAPSHEEVRVPSAPAQDVEAVIEDGVYEVEPELEMEAPVAPESGRVLPVGERAREEMREGLGLMEEAPASGLAELEAIGAIPIPEEHAPSPFSIAEEPAPAAPHRAAAPPRAAAPQAPAAAAPPAIPEEMIRSIAEETIARFAREYFSTLPPPQPPRLSDETLRRGIEEAVGGIIREMAWEVIERVAWEVVPQVAEMMIRHEIDKLKSETMPE